MKTSSATCRYIGNRSLWFMFALWCACVGVPAHAQTVEYIHTDALGSPIAVTNANQQVIERSEYAPYGDLLNRPDTDGPGYTGHVLDAATGMNYMQQRYYDPSIGRFLSVDPVTALEKPITNFTRYVYALNSPYKFTDPDGREIRISGSQEYKKMVALDIGAIKAGTGGAALVNRLEKSEHVITIQETVQENKTAPSSWDAQVPGRGSDAKVLFDTNSLLGGTDTEGRRARPPYVGLAHEFGHAEEMINGVWKTNNDAPPGGTPPSEVYSMKVENMVRREHGLPERASYYEKDERNEP